MFDAIAKRYDFLNHFLSAGIDRRWRRQAIDALKLTGRERLLDLCTGTADLAIAAVAATPSARHVVGVDFAAAMLAIGREKLRSRNLLQTVRLVRGDATSVPLASKSVDVVTAAFGIRNVENVGAAFAEMHRVLAPGGRFAILEFANPTTPGISGLYRWYSLQVLPRIGAWLSKHNDAYGYLPASIRAFASPDDLVRLFQSNGFTDVEARPLTLGIVYLYTGCRR
jgi:demethylmenaquinone methyltransferase/2-methoxy-6-polyprenyl-1,4-benzoquinol methylase